MLEWKGGRGRRVREGRRAWAERKVRREQGGARDREGEGVWVWMCGMEAVGGGRTDIRGEGAMYGGGGCVGAGVWKEGRWARGRGMHCGGGGVMRGVGGVYG